MSTLHAAKSAIESEIARLEAQLDRLGQALEHLNNAIGQTGSNPAAGTKGVPATAKAAEQGVEQAVTRPAEMKGTAAASKRATKPANESVDAKNVKPVASAAKATRKKPVAKKITHKSSVKTAPSAPETLEALVEPTSASVSPSAPA